MLKLLAQRSARSFSFRIVPETRTPRPSGARQDPREGLEVFRVGLEPADAVVVDRLHDGVVDGRGDADATALGADGAVEVIDLRPPPAGHVLEQRGPATREVAGAGRHVALDVGEAAPLYRVDEPLCGDAVDRLDLVARRAADPDDLGGDRDRDATRDRLPPDLPRPPPRHARERGRPAVSSELSAALPPEGRPDVGGGRVGPGNPPPPPP